MFKLEYNNLAGTVERLHYQKSEAKRRLKDMDAQREALEKTLADMQAKIEEDEKEAAEAVHEAERVKNSAQVNECTCFLCEVTTQSRRKRSRCCMR